MLKPSIRFDHFVFTAARCVCIAILGCLAIGCGGGNTPPTPVFAMNGNYSIAATSAGTSGLNTFGGAIQTDSTGHVTGTMHVQGRFFLCFGVPLDLPLAGTIDSVGRLNATIVSPNNQTITLNASVSPDGATLSNGSYSAGGTGCASGDQGSIAGFQVQAFTGNYAVTFNPSSSTTISMVLPVTQSATPNTHGTFPLSASAITISGGAGCGFSSATLVPAASAASGNDFELLLLGSDDLSLMILIGVTTDGTTNVVHGIALIDTGPCSGQNGLITLTRQ